MPVFLSRPQIMLALYSIASVSTLIIFVLSLSANGSFTTDFKYFWLAGTNWLNGISPYGSELQTLGHELFPSERVNPFFYPPNWQTLCSALALLDPKCAAVLFAAGSSCALILSAWLLAGMFAPNTVIQTRWQAFVILLAIILIGFHSSTIAVSVGQPTAYLLLAWTALLRALQSRHTIIVILALVTLLLKPQFSLPLIFALIVFDPWIRKPALIAGFLTAVLVWSGLGWTSPQLAFAEFLNNVALYGSFPENWSIHVSGPSFVLALFGVTDTSAVIWLVLCCAVIIVGGLLLRKDSLSPQLGHNARDVALLVNALILFVVPTHNTDLILALPTLLLIVGSSSSQRLVLFVGFMLIMRSLNLSVLSEGFIFTEKTVWLALFDTLGSGLILLAAIEMIRIRAKDQVQADPISSDKTVIFSA